MSIARVSDIICNHLDRLMAEGLSMPSAINLYVGKNVQRDIVREAYRYNTYLPPGLQNLSFLTPYGSIKLSLSCVHEESLSDYIGFKSPEQLFDDRFYNDLEKAIQS